MKERKIRKVKRLVAPLYMVVNGYVNNDINKLIEMELTVIKLDVVEGNVVSLENILF